MEAQIGLWAADRVVRAAEQAGFNIPCPGELTCWEA
jgi:hypothetical protein